MKLAEFQKTFFESLNQPEVLSEGMKIYQSSMRSTLFHTLSKIFPSCKRLVGDEFFAKVAWNYIDFYPSLSPNLNHYGEQFPEFIEASHNMSLPYFNELAKLEWYWHQSFNGANNRSISLEDLSQAILKQGDNIVFSLAENCRLLKFEFSINKIWQSCQPEYQGNFGFNLNGPCYLALFQLNHKVMMLELNLAEWTFLSYVSKGLSLLKICKILEDLDLRPGPAECLPKLCQLQLIHVKNEEIS
ncbi:MAG: hypothetical protein K0R66_162 [Gammaproteobacteria bacterium]|jgi:hypothetical protein|nr:hypothetical protein [Gammaproteobacteria bacterium]